MVRDRDRVEVRHLGSRTEQDDRTVPCRGADRGRRFTLRRHDDEPIDTAAHRAQRGDEFVDVGMRTRDQYVHPLAPCRQIDPPDDLGEELAVQIGQQDADRVRAVRDQAARGSVRPEAQLLGHGAHAPARVLADALAVIENARHGGHRDSGFTRHILDGRHRRGLRRVPASDPGRVPVGAPADPVIEHGIVAHGAEHCPTIRLEFSHAGLVRVASSAAPSVTSRVCSAPSRSSGTRATPRTIRTSRPS